MTLKEKIIQSLQAASNRKAKDIARELGTTRKEVNRELYRHKGALFRKDDGHRWTFSDEEKATLVEKVSKAIEDAVPSIRAFMEASEMNGRPADMPGVQGSPGDLTWDAQQEEIRTAPAGERLLVVAPPGTGKTAVLCGRVQHLVVEQGVNSSNILVVSFTRTAVAEIRSRIEGFIGSAKTSSLRISTIDSTAWSLQQGFPAEESSTGSNDWSSSDYDLSIEQVIELVGEGDEDLMDFLESFDHIIVDEAQDVIGVRSRFISLLIEKLGEDCGFTILADPLQAIYDFTQDAEGADPVALLESMAGEAFRMAQFTKVYRYEDPMLEETLREARAIVEGDGAPAEKAKCLSSLLEQSSSIEKFDGAYKDLASSLRGQDDTLVLSRSRADVLLQSSYLCTGKVPHKVRMSGLPDCIYPWIGHLFHDYEEHRISEKEMTALLESRVGDNIDPGLAWNCLFRIARKKKDIDMRLLRSRLSRRRPPVEACFLDCGMQGPILGTIHASKGREARRVILSMPTIEDNERALEELRVLYVGSTRAMGKLELNTQEGARYFRNMGGESGQNRVMKIDGAAIKRNQYKRFDFQLEVGQKNDFDETSVVSTRIDGKEVVAAQEVLWEKRFEVERLDANQDKELDWQFVLSRQGDEPTFQGWLSSAFKDGDLRAAAGYVARKYDVKWLKPNYLHFACRVGVRTIVLGEDDARLGEIHEPYSSSGFYLAPVVRGWCKVIAYP
jgi:hypothetical protein